MTLIPSNFHKKKMCVQFLRGWPYSISEYFVLKNVGTAVLTGEGEKLSSSSVSQTDRCQLHAKCHESCKRRRGDLN